MDDGGEAALAKQMTHKTRPHSGPERLALGSDHASPENLLRNARSPKWAHPITPRETEWHCSLRRRRAKPCKGHEGQATSPHEGVRPRASPCPDADV